MIGFERTTASQREKGKSFSRKNGTYRGTSASHITKLVMELDK